MDNKQKQLALEQKEKYFQYTETKWKLCNENVKLTDLKKQQIEKNKEINELKYYLCNIYILTKFGELNVKM